MNKRQRKLLTILSDGRQASVNDLSERLSVSPATVRQDLGGLEKQGFLRRVHGGAVIDETDDISHRMAIRYEKKLSIAKAAAKFVHEGETIFIEAGSVNALLAKEVSLVGRLTIATCNAFIARQASRKSSNNVLLLGGIYQGESQNLVGNLAKLCLAQINFSKVFIGVDGFTIQNGFTGRDMMRADLNQEVIRKGQEVFILSDSSKFGKIALAKYSDVEDIDYLITDTDLPEEYRRFFEASSVNLIIADG
ncbi:MAG: DeoR/GlpR transcriptional regulator [Spirochaetales bacterium]|nr:MAG: DeoR/GlpR transcriptional regulator [Spirochaetales bacterium]